MNEFFKSILDWIFSWVGNYGWSVVIFTLLIRLIIFPFDYKSRVGMRKTTQLQPKLAALQKKYANDKDKLNQKTAELYKKEGVNPLSSCLPLLLTYPILIWMFTAMRMVSYEHVVAQIISVCNNPTQLPVFDSWLWVKNLWMPDSPFSSSLPDLNTLRQITSDIWVQILSANDGAGLVALQNLQVMIDGVATTPLAGLTMESFTADLNNTIASIYTALANTGVYITSNQPIPGWTINLLFTTVTLQQLWNGLYILPVLSAVSQLLMTKLTPQQPQPNADPKNQAPSTGKFMMYFFPLFSLWICSSYNGMFALYWVTGNLIAMVQTVAINKYLDYKEQKKLNAPEVTK